MVSSLLFLGNPASFNRSFRRRNRFSIDVCSINTSHTIPEAHHSPNVVEILEERGLLESLTSDDLRKACSDPTLPPFKVYYGFNPTAQSLHLGNLLGIIILSWFPRCGHRAVALIGGAMARVGDPSGKSLERPELDPETLVNNTLGITDTIAKVLGNHQSESHNFSRDLKSLVILNNYDWWKELRLLDFLKQVGRFARVGTMMSKESVKKRLESKQGMSFTEFTYQLLQGYDFLYLFENEGVNVQIGGSDQWGNITAGTDLIRKILQVGGAYGLTFPLLLKSDGTKFGKFEDGAVWLSPSMLSPYKFYQYFISVPDADVAQVHRHAHNFREVQQCTLLSIKTGGCSEDCSYCPQSSRYDTGLKAQKLMTKDVVLDAAKKAKEAGSTRFCMGAAWRDTVGRKTNFNQILEYVKQLK